MQPTTLCNLNCSYCYLPTRTQRRQMPPVVAASVAAAVTGRPVSEAVTVVWHGGEPLAMPIAGFEELLAPFESGRVAGAVRHSVQSNATLITDRWCDLLAR
ncbi:MAG: radical SAM protein, partial [Sporichthyaceae bacterium]|nr:radical SAM protein [Sporichthyaceae bacterium]